MGHFTERKQFYIGNFINVKCVFKLKTWDILSYCPEHNKHQKFKPLLYFSSRTKASFMNMQFAVTNCLRVLLLSLENNYFVNYNQYGFCLGMKGLSEHPLDGVQLLHGVTGASYTSYSPLQQTFLEETTNTFVLEDKKGMK